MRRGIIIVFLVLSFTSGCGTGTQHDEATATEAAKIPAEALERARSAVGSMGAQLMGALVHNLEAGGPVEAVRVCSEVAPSIATDHSRDGLLIRRVSLKVRNPIDSPDAYERAVLEKWAALSSTDALPGEWAEMATVDGRHVLRYMKPIVVMRPCLTCHGDPASMQSELRSLLEERYPDDEATGYKESDLRGAFSVTVEM
jgi:hypothetical protein